MKSVSHETKCFTLNIAAQIEQRKQGFRKNIHHRGTLCSKCLERPPASTKERYCVPCRAADRRARRKAAQEQIAAERAELARLRAITSEQTPPIGGVYETGSTTEKQQTKRADQNGQKKDADSKADVAGSST